MCVCVKLARLVAGFDVFHCLRAKLLPVTEPVRIRVDLKRRGGRECEKEASVHDNDKVSWRLACKMEYDGGITTGR